MEGYAEELTSAIDEKTGDYTGLTRFKPGADTSSFGAKSHCYPVEIRITARFFRDTLLIQPNTPQ